MPSVYKEIQIVEQIIHPKRYLEVGVREGINLSKVEAKYKIGIDISPKTPKNYPIKIYVGTSDAIFSSEEFKKEEPFDLIFIDAFHEYRQVVRDINNALNFLKHKGIIICHDVYPFDRLGLPNLTDKQPPNPLLAWTGDVWKVVFHVRWLMPELDYYVVKNFPGYLYLWKPKKLREINTSEIKERLGTDIVNEDIIDELTEEWALNNLDLMNIITLENLRRKIKRFLYG